MKVVGVHLSVSATGSWTTLTSSTRTSLSAGEVGGLWPGLSVRGWGGCWGASTAQRRTPSSQASSGRPGDWRAYDCSSGLDMRSRTPGLEQGGWVGVVRPLALSGRTALAGTTITGIQVSLAAGLPSHCCIRIPLWWWWLCHHGPLPRCPGPVGWWCLWDPQVSYLWLRVQEIKKTNLA